MGTVVRSARSGAQHELNLALLRHTADFVCTVVFVGLGCALPFVSNKFVFSMRSVWIEIVGDRTVNIVNVV